MVFLDEKFSACFSHKPKRTPALCMTLAVPQNPSFRDSQPGPHTWNTPGTPCADHTLLAVEQMIHVVLAFLACVVHWRLSPGPHGTNVSVKIICIR